MPLGRRELLLRGGAVLWPWPAAAARRKTVNGVEIPIPPAERPRLYLRPSDVAGLPARLKHPAVRPAVERIEALAATSPQIRVEWEALHCLVSRDRDQGRGTVEETLALLREATLPKISDAARVTGRMMVTGAMVYDWLYDLLTLEEKQSFLTEFLRLAHTLECGYPPVKQGSINGHTSEAMLMRDLMSAGIAAYEEFPEIYEVSASRFFREHVRARNWFYGGHAYHQGDSYSSYRYNWDVFALFIFDRLGAGNIYNPEQRWVPYYFLYSTRPDGRRLRSGDTYAFMRPKGQPWTEDLGTLLTASYYGDGVLLGQHLRQTSGAGKDSIFELLWRDLSLQPASRDKLPLTRYFGFPFGWMIARTGWGENAAIVEMKVNEYNFLNHQHADAGAFQIYYRGALAIDSGLYQGTDGAYGSPHCKNYYWRTIAHNCLLIHDPEENFGIPDISNDGGQRLPNRRREPLSLNVMLAEETACRTGEVRAHGFGPDYSYLQGDLTRAYSRKAKHVQRAFAFLNLKDETVPAALVVFDRVVSADPGFKKYWLLHTLDEPAISGRSACVDAPGEGGGRLILDVLLPEASRLDPVGGPGKEFWVFGRNYPNEPRPAYKDRSDVEAGAWRIELTPAEDAAEHLFLTVLQVTGKSSGARRRVSPLAAEDRTGCLIEGPTVTWAVLFRQDGVRSGKSVRFTVPSSGGNVRCLVTDLEPGAWVAEGAGGGAQDLTVSASSGAAWFEGPGGGWKLRPDRESRAAD